MKFLLGVLCALSIGQLQATTIAVIDSGVDYKHKDLKLQMWENSVDKTVNDRDEDDNGYEDDIRGWNFAESNNQIIDYKYVGTLNAKVRKFFKLQERAIRGRATRSDLNWMKDIRKDKKFIKRMQVYGNFMHGTHVAGIAANEAKGNKILGIKLIPTEVKLPGQSNPIVDRRTLRNMIRQVAGFTDWRSRLLKLVLGRLATQQVKKLEEIADYIHGHKVPVTNGSFGTGYRNVKVIITVIYKGIFRKDPTPADLKDIGVFFLSKLNELGKEMAETAPNTLFVFAAGNDGLSNDIYPAYPASIGAKNTISVAATIDRHSLASFSNRGAKTVDVAAPGVGIYSAAPDNKHLSVSGTSQAAPFVAKVAGMMKTANPALKPRQLKTLLMKTVDRHPFLAQKVKSGGIVNESRAVKAASLAKTLTLKEAVAQSFTAIPAPVFDGNKSFMSMPSQPVFVAPLPSPFNL